MSRAALAFAPAVQGARPSELPALRARLAAAGCGAREDVLVASVADDLASTAEALRELSRWVGELERGLAHPRSGRELLGVALRAPLDRAASLEDLLAGLRKRSAQLAGALAG